MILSRQLVMSLSSILVLTACSTEKSATRSNKKNTNESVSNEETADASGQANGSALTGTWVSTCFNSPEVSIKMSMTFSATGLEQTEYRYLDQTCSQPFLKKTAMQSYTIVGEDNTTMSNKIDIRTESVTVTPMTEQAVSGGNSSNIYGFSDWVLNTPKDVAGLRESPQGPPEDQKGQMFHSLIKTEGSNLYLGSQTAENDGSSGEKRHVQLDQTLILSKQN